MAKAKMELALKTSAPDVWAVVGGFGSPQEWHPLVTSVELSEDGKNRTLKLANGAQTVERELVRNDAMWQYQYTIEESGLPVKGYVSTFKAWPSETGCTLTWESDFTPNGAPEPQAVALIEKVYNAAAASLYEKFGNAAE